MKRRFCRKERGGREDEEEKRWWWWRWCEAIRKPM
jgi:hypothetical protein